MSAGDGFFVDSNVLLYSVDPVDSAQLPYWDALILAGAQRSGARYLLSEDFQSARRYEDIQVLNPFEQSPAEFL